VEVLGRVMAVIVVLIVAVTVVTSFEAPDPLPLLVCAALVLASLLAALKWPVIGLALAALAPTVAALMGVNPISVWSAACFIAFLLTVRGLPGTLTAVVLGLSNLLGAALFAGTVFPAEDTAPSIAAFGAVLASSVGSAVRGHHQYWSELEHRTRDAEQTRQAAVDRGIAEERLRIARDLHDSVGHRIAIVSMRLGAAEVHLRRDPDAAAEDLVSARGAVKDVLAEVQSILQVLRVSDESSSLAPTPAHGLLPDLVDSVTRAGLEVESSLVGIGATLPQSVSAATYRIVQESLTNAQRHGTGSVSLAVEVPTDGQGDVLIEVVNRVDPTHAGADTGSGKGLVGMQERAASVRGRLDAHQDGTLYWVRAQLPVDGRGRP